MPEPHPPLKPIPLADIQAARARIAGTAVRTPLVRLHSDAPSEIHLKLETLQPIGSFKLRGALNAMRLLPAKTLAGGVYTVSAGNMAQGVAWAARELAVPCRVVAPDHTPQTKLDAIARLGATVVRVPFADWWRAIVEFGVPGETGAFIHPGADPTVIAGNATAGLEIVEDLPDVDAILVPYGSGGLACGIACAAHALRPGVRVYACEVETAAPFSASLAAGRPVAVEYTPTFVDGIGGKTVLEQIWPLAREVLAGSIVVSVRQVADAVRMLAERTRVIAEGAGAAPVAAALAHDLGVERVACVVSGGNIDSRKLAQILNGQVP
ncbi:MAG TPA: pyridoxal-phosphate dependent enzyme [Gemmatimonadaceae bacterium]|nr:pyridoxal-phosphate dependent enzyme [Gemmatimonadaceae bacterium]